MLANRLAVIGSALSALSSVLTGVIAAAVGYKAIKAPFETKEKKQQRQHEKVVAMRRPTPKIVRRRPPARALGHSAGLERKFHS